MCFLSLGKVDLPSTPPPPYLSNLFIGLSPLRDHENKLRGTFSDYGIERQLVKLLYVFILCVIYCDLSAEGGNTPRISN